MVLLHCANNACQLRSFDIRSTWQITRRTVPFNWVNCSAILSGRTSRYFFCIAIDTDELHWNRVLKPSGHEIAAILPCPTGRTSHLGRDHYMAHAICCSADGARNVVIIIRCKWCELSDFIFCRIDMTSILTLDTCDVAVILWDLRET